MKARVSDKEVEILTAEPGNGAIKITFIETVDHEGEKIDRQAVAFIKTEDLIIEPNNETK